MKIENAIINKIKINNELEKEFSIDKKNNPGG